MDLCRIHITDLRGELPGRQCDAPAGELVTARLLVWSREAAALNLSKVKTGR
jgi:hypothetical protein